jgi:hypothetical protein
MAIESAPSNGENGSGSGPAKYVASGTNHHCVLTGRETVIIEDREIPRPAAGHVLCKIMSTGICGSDVRPYTHCPLRLVLDRCT